MVTLLAAVALSAVLENQRPGTPDWEIANAAVAREIEGYASQTSVNGGEPIDLFVHTTEARYTIDVFRTGWYGGAGARRVAGPIARSGIVQEMPAPDPTTGLVECRWRDPYRLDTRDDSGPWPSGVYLARLTAGSTGRQSFIVFVVRDDEREAALVFQSSVTTFAAYNNWGGKSLSAFNSGNAPARKISFDRPYATDPYGVRLDGAGEFLRRWEYNAVRFLEREGYDVVYVTDVDTHRRPIGAAAPREPRIFLSVGHDEYWSWEMRQHVEAARERGVHLAFLGSGTCYWQIRFEPNARGDADRTIVGYKDAAGELDPLALDGMPQNDRRITGRWRDRPTSRPEEGLVGVMYAADPVDADIVVSDAGHWVFAGTGLKNGDALPGLLGYVVDAGYGSGPRSVERLARSPFVDQGRTRYADMVIHTADSGALVFATGSMQWNWGLDGYNAPAWHAVRVSGAAQRITRTVLNRMLDTHAARPRQTAAKGRPSATVIVASLVAAAIVLRAWLARPSRHEG
jgi:hypothetical protein